MLLRAGDCQLRTSADQSTRRPYKRKHVGELMKFALRMSRVRLTHYLGTAAYCDARITRVSPGLNVSGNVGEVKSTALCYLPAGERCSRGLYGASDFFLVQVV